MGRIVTCVLLLGAFVILLGAACSGDSGHRRRVAIVQSYLPNSNSTVIQIQAVVAAAGPQPRQATGHRQL